MAFFRSLLKAIQNYLVLGESIFEVSSFFAKRCDVTHGQDLVEKLPDKKAHSKCLQLLLYEAAERRAEELRFGGGSSRESWRGRELKHREDKEV